MNVILFRGKYVKPIIELLNKDENHLFLVKYDDGSKGLFFRKVIPLLGEYTYKQVVITKKDYNRLRTLISIMDNPLESFESIYYEYI